MTQWIFLIVGLAVAMGAWYLVKNGVGQFAVPIFLAGLAFAATGAVWALAAIML